MAKAMSAATEERIRRPGPDDVRGPNPSGSRDTARFLIVKNGLFWGSIALSGAAIYGAASIFF
ncbi:hypothetical protein [Roseibium sp.]|uniref:hypothetical protein n=1 Tax=Roseibium sp. TaxID=1936156 RepID=UPI003BAC390E